MEALDFSLPQSPQHERERLRTLDEYDVLDAPPAEAFDRITRLATRLFDVPIAMVNFIDQNEQWCIAAQGLTPQSTPRNLSFCTHTIRSDEVMIVPDATQDPRFSGNPFVTGEPGIRFYAGAPLIAANGHRLGTVCLIDRVPHEDFDEGDRDALKDIAGVVMDELNLRRFAVDLNASKEAFRASSVHTRRILESITDAFFALDNDWTFSYVNARAEDMLDANREELIGKNIWDVFPDAVGSTFQEEYERAVQKKETVQFMEYYPPLDIWFEVRAYPFRGGLSVYFRDVSERVEARRDLRREQDLVDAIVGTSVAAIVTIDAETETLAFVNPRAEEILGIGEDAVGQHQSAVGNLTTLDGSPIDPDAWPFYDIVETGAHVRNLRLGLERADGETRVISVNGAPLTGPNDETVQQVVFSIIDITEQIRRERELEEAKEEAERASRLKSSFLANMSHDVRTPLSSIMSLTELLSLEAPDHLQERISLIERSSIRLLDTIDSVLDLSKIESGSTEPDLSDVDVADELLGTIEIFRPQAAQKGVNLHAEIPDASVQAMLDPSYLHRISDNLIGNAVKFTPEGGDVTVQLSSDDEHVHIRVSDTGIGIEEPFLDDLFEAFTRGANGTKEQGSGLGLAITKRLTELLGGSIDVESTVGEGTTFTVTLPREASDESISPLELDAG
jgi:PAS domain S-box-containing protein